jgi:hypothetical protein
MPHIASGSLLFIGWRYAVPCAHTVHRLRLLSSSHVSVVGGEWWSVEMVSFRRFFLEGFFCIAYPLVATYLSTEILSCTCLLAVALWLFDGCVSYNCSVPNKPCSHF